MKYQRFISYLYQYTGGEKVKNTGYVKVEQKGSMIRISLRNKLMEHDESEYYVFLICRQEGEEKHNHSVLLSKLTPSQGMLVYQYITGQDKGFGTYASIDDFVGVLIRGAKQAVYMTVWQDVEVWPEQIVCVENNVQTANGSADMPAYESGEMTGVYGAEGNRAEQPESYTQKDRQQDAQASGIYDEKNDVQKFNAEGGMTEEPSVNKDINDEESSMKGGQEAAATEILSEQKVAADTGGEAIKSGADYLFRNRSPLPAVEGSQLVDCIRIEPQDLGLLHMRNWRYGSNSFVNHGYYRYRYLLLGKLRFQDDSVKMILGVPSIYTSKEKYLANMFGFDQFVTSRRTDRKINQFGYWLAELTT